MLIYLELFVKARKIFHKLVQYKGVQCCTVLPKAETVNDLT
jgi:hypothetical protein